MAPHDRQPTSFAHRRAQARWRWGFAAYAALLATATHWPALEIGTEAVPAADKALHLYAFAVLTAFLWKTGWIRSVFAIMFVALIWVAIDELTQSLPILERQFSSLDVISSALGVIVAGAWIAAMRPRGGTANRLRLSLQRHVMDSIVGGPLSGVTIIAWLLVGALLAQIGLGLLFILPIVLAGWPSLGPALAYGFFQAVLVGICLIALEKIVTRTRDAVVSSRTCPGCGIARACDEFDSAGWGSCAGCGVRLHRGIWQPAIAPDSAQLRRFGQRPAALAICVIGFAVAAFYLAILGYGWAVESGESGSGALRLARAIHDLPDDFVFTVDMALILLALAAMARMYRGRLARWHDSQHISCRRCGYDLRATPTHQGIGACPECGTAFANMHPATPGAR